MGRPKTVNIKTFPLYNKLHTELVKMYSGVTMTALYPIKETDKFFVSSEVWAYCCSKFRRKKTGFKLSVNIPTITDAKTIAFLEEHCWTDWVTKHIDEESDIKETIDLLKNIFPDKEAVFFYELDSIINAYTHGSFISYDENGILKKQSERAIKDCKYYTNKYFRYNGFEDFAVKAAYDEYHNFRGNEKMKSAKFTIYYNLSQDYNYKNFCLDDVFIEIGKNSVCYPVAFTDNTAEWSIEKYGKLIGYAHAGEIFFVVTPTKIYFEIKRHY